MIAARSAQPMAGRSSEDDLSLGNGKPAECARAEVKEFSVGFFDFEGLAVDLRGHLSVSSFALILYRIRSEARQQEKCRPAPESGIK